MAIEMKKTKVKLNEAVHLGISILDISETLMCKFWYDYIKPRYGDLWYAAKLCYADTDSFVVHIITEDFYEDIDGDVERWFVTSNYDQNECNSIDKRPLPIGKNRKVIGIFNPIQDGSGGEQKAPTADQFFPYNFYKRRN